MDGQIRLRWTSHQGTILSVFDALLSSESFVDVTLACEGHYIRAHKVILSACSPYFQELLNVDLTKHPIFFLKDVKYRELQALIQYMYRGEVNIAQEDLTSLLQVAQALKIRGLADVETANNSIASDTIILPDLGNRPKPQPPPTVVPLPHPPAPTLSSSNAHFPRNFQQAQTHSFAPPNVNSTVSSPIIASAPTAAAPPPSKKSRTETRLSTQSVQVQKQTQVDPLLNPLPAPSTSQLFDPLLHSSNTYASSHYESAGHVPQDAKFEDEGMVEQPEVYGTEEVKVEAITGAITVDLDDEEEEENSMSQSSFSESWQLGEGDGSGMADDDGEVPSGSGSGGTSQRRTTEGGAEGGEGASKDGKAFTCLKCERVFGRKETLLRHHRFSRKCTEGKNVGSKFACTMCTKSFSRRDNLKRHQLLTHHTHI